jgi:hypothetical protein
MNSFIEVARIGWEKSVGDCSPEVRAGQTGNECSSELMLEQIQIYGVEIFHKS